MGRVRSRHDPDGSVVYPRYSAGDPAPGTSPERFQRMLDAAQYLADHIHERKQLNLSRFYAIAQIEYCRNFIFKRNFPIHKLFERSCEFGLWWLTADKKLESNTNEQVRRVCRQMRVGFRQTAPRRF
jgi:hypothetical protein